MADYAILCAGAWSVPIYPTLPAGQVAPLLNDCGAKAIFVSTLEQLGKILTIKAQCPNARPRHPRRGQSARRARLHDLPRRRGSRPADARDEPGRLRAARRAREARGRRDDHLHLGHDRRAQGRDADPPQLRLQRRDRLRGDPVRGRRARAVLPPALARLRADDRLRVHAQDRRDRVRRVDRQAGGELPRAQPLLLRRRAARLREGPRQDHGEGRRGQPAQQEALHLGDRRGPRARGVHGAGRARCRPASRARRRSPTRWSSRRSGPRSGPTSASPSRGARRCRATSRSSSSARASRSTRATD